MYPNVCLFACCGSSSFTGVALLHTYIMHLVSLPTLVSSLCTDMSHNKLGDGSGRAVAKLLNGHAPKLASVDLSDNLIGIQGGVAIGHVLQLNNTLRELNLRMNGLYNEGVQPIVKALERNTSLLCLNIGSNNVGESSAPALSDVSV